jgi:hypothetical protein
MLQRGARHFSGAAAAVGDVVAALERRSMLAACTGSTEAFRKHMAVSRAVYVGVRRRPAPRGRRG